MRISRSRRGQSPLLVAAVTAGLLAALAALRPGAATQTADALQPATSAGDQVDLALTVYNSDLALVRDVRQIDIASSTSDLRFMDIAATVNPATVHFRSLSDPARVRVVEQNYEYDLLQPDKLLQKYVGRDVTIVRQRDGRAEEIRARLLANNNGPVWRIGNEIVTGLAGDHYRFPELPENLYSRPTLVWKIENTGPRRQRVEASYLASRLSWTADYVLTVGADDRRADLDGWVTMTNNSGTAFEHARLQLVAGDLNRVMQDYRRDPGVAKRALEAAASPPPFAQESFSEYHLYTLGRKTSIHDKEIKQISLLTGSGVPVQKVFVVEGQQFYYRNAHHPGSPIKDAVKVYFKLRNDQASGLGMPMPAGTVRVYQADRRGGIQFVGEDRIGHTPKDEAVSLHIGSAFDVVCERRQTDFRRISDRVFEAAFEITLRNRKETPIAVEVNEPVGGDWEMLSASHEWIKTDAWAARFAVPVEAGGTSVLRYRVRIR
jgi:hypothetical protein